MAVTPLRPINRFAPGLAVAQPAVLAKPTLQTLAAKLMQNGLVPPHIILQALAQQDSRRKHLADMLLARSAVPPSVLYDAIAAHWQVGRVDLAALPPDPRLTSHLDHVSALRFGLLPWCKTGHVTVIVTAYPDTFHQHSAWLERIFGPVAMAVAPMLAIEDALLAVHGAALATASETRVNAAESCRAYHTTTLQRPAAGIVVAMIAFALFQPVAAMVWLFALALGAMLSSNIMKLIAFILMHRPQTQPQSKPAIVAHLPIVSVMVALYRESNIATQLTARLDRLIYPRELLDILLVVEAEDQMTRDALGSADLPGWMRVIVVPDGSVKTKPRALNYALDHCRGAIVGIYDAEDAPEPDQLQKVVDRFHQRGPEVVCLQGQLEYYNPRSNWLARCFTIEYASWFRMFLPGIERMGLAIPLGGTTLFFRRSALEELGGWDAQNVTEDADLGLRLFRHGYRTELIDTTTFEEANCRSFPWVKQRSRWIKGYMMTWITHMRDPRLLWQQLGARCFIGFQVQFLGSILQTLLAPLLWSLWLTPLGFHHPFSSAIGADAFRAIYISMIATTVLSLVFDIAGMRRTQHRLNPLWALTLHFYHPLATLAGYKALWELMTKPFYWDKTSHGHF
ncbi:glycosyl transferase [Cypionkella aquatica]|uniref:Glycosyl transferase n=1 Tax=Cypionkella aquatica TaxID=1756042 RepID=A0AA37U6G6_9RHOB|nr:glycosyltransferase family 2 protein [Cypionkella aquatica]GLS86441.1 glycosyl transferase [Cypionkella aquatica]